MEFKKYENTNKPLSPRLEPPSRVFLVWDISYRCNYDCSYCSTHESLSNNSVYISSDKIREISYDMYRCYSSCHIRFSGGEPFIYPNFIEILQILSEYHTLEVSTNLSIDVNRLKESLSPELIILSNSFHPEFVNIDEFLKKVLFLKNNEFKLSVTFVAYPPFLKQMGYYKEIIEKNGIPFIIQLFHGSFSGRIYPGEYSDTEKALLKDYVDTSLHKSANNKIFEYKISEYKIGVAKKKTKICHMGQMYAKIDHSGDIFRCCAKDSPKLGNILDSGLELLNEPLPCEIVPCPCWKAMIVNQEESWLKLWDYPKHPKRYELIEEKEGWKEKNIVRQISFSWDLHYVCNYRCPYCWFYSKWQHLTGQNKYYPTAELLKSWTNIHKKYGSAHIDITGGEPFIYPNFTELVKELSNIHTIWIATNLSVDIDNFVKQVNSSNVKVNPTFHPLFANFDKFIKKLLLLKEKGIADRVTFLAYPPQIKLIKYYTDKFNEYGIPLSVLTFWGKYNGISYPQGYTLEEKSIIMPHLSHRQEEKFQLEPKEVKGRLCRAGQIYATIQADGSVYRCGGVGSQLIGNFFSSEFNLLEEPLPCESESCPCNEWAGLLLDAEKPIDPTKEKRDNIEVSSAIETELTEIKKGFDRSSIPPNRVFLTWDIHYGCNYNCTYCNTPKPWDAPGKWDKDRDKVSYPGVKRWLDIWQDIYKRYGSCEIHITGGEPFVYPSFIELIMDLSQIHTLEIITNLALDVNDIINSVMPDRVRIGTTFHPEFADLKEFLNKHIILREHGFDTWANYVAYPPQLDKMTQYKKEFDKLGISFNIQPFMGYFQEREYPMGYTDSELSYLKGSYVSDDIVNKKTIEWKTGSGQKNTKGKPCRMGQMYAKIYPIGDAYRCCADGSKKLGNLIEGSFELLDEALPCECRQCFCWRCMLVEEEVDWSGHWVIPEKKNYKNVNV